MKFRVTPEELAQQQLVRPGWHPVEIVDVKEGTDKDGAGLTTVRGRVIGGDDGDKGAILRTNFSEKAPGFVKNFVESIGVKFEANKDYDVTNNNFKGKKMEWYVERDQYKGRPTNNVLDYRPLSA